jgi:hypothetical protein
MKRYQVTLLLTRYDSILTPILKFFLIFQRPEASGVVIVDHFLWWAGVHSLTAGEEVCGQEKTSLHTLRQKENLWSLCLTTFQIRVHFMPILIQILAECRSGSGFFPKVHKKL